MCGIAGFMHSTGLFYTDETLKKMLYSIRYRGPDAMGIYIDDYTALGHVRLSILDLSGGNQPIHNEDKTVWITYNGEIYNYLELRIYLEHKGHAFSTMTDTEVLVHLYEEEGTEFLSKLNGQWAFALWDSRKKRLFCSRDRVGVRPFYYTVCRGTFIFSSEIKALFTIPDIERTVDPVAIDQIFTVWTTLPGKTAFKNINELMPGHFLVIDQDSITTKKYWNVEFASRDEWLTDTPEAIAMQLEELLVDAVKIRLRADVPVGTYLSGGLDSSGITSIVARRFNPEVQTFGIRFDSSHFDEGMHQLEMVRFLNVRHHELRVSDEVIGDHFLKVVDHCEKPLLRTAPVPLYLLSQLVSDANIKVVLTGEGADEFHGGYDIFKEALIRRFWARQPESLWRGRLIERLYPDIFHDDRSRKLIGAFFKKGMVEFTDPVYSHLIRWNNTIRIKTFFSPDCAAMLAPIDTIQDCRFLLPEHFNDWHMLQKSQFIEVSLFLSNYLLSSQGDRVGMAHSVEVRLPFLDHRIIEYMSRVPPWMKMCGLHEKHILKKALRSFLPASITARVKHPYRAPVHGSLLLLLDSAEGEELLSEKSLKQSGFFDYSKIGFLINKLRNTDTASEMDAMALAGIVSTQYISTIFLKNRSETIPDSYRAEVFIDRRTSH